MRKPIQPRTARRLGALGILLAFAIPMACESGSNPMSAGLTGSDSPGAVDSSDDSSRDSNSQDSNSQDSNSQDSNSQDSNSRDSNSQDSNSRDDDSRDDDSRDDD